LIVGAKLEIHVLIQVACTLIIYACWWNKPLDVNEPITIDITTPDTPPLQGKTVKELELEEGKNAPQPMNRQYITKRCPPNLISITAKACYDIIVYIDPKDEEELSKTNPTINDKDETQITTTPDNNNRTIKKIKKTLPMVAEGLIVGFIGLLHAAAWNVHFPTELERWLWRISSIGMCIFPTAVVFIATCTWYQQDLTDTIWEVHLLRFNVVTFVLAALYKIHDVARKHSLKLDGEDGEDVSFVRYAAHMVLILVCLGSLLAYAICIIFITVESYISVRDPPDRSMITPLWSNYWPHL
jgi:hypothetical protein